MTTDPSNIRKHKTFLKWKASFLAQLEEQLEDFDKEHGLENAQRAHDDFYAVHLVPTTRAVDTCHNYLQQGLLSSSISVKGRNSLHEVCRHLRTCGDALAALLPATVAEEAERGYTKVHLGAYLVRQGFGMYEDLLHLQRVIEDELLSPALLQEEVLDKQQRQVLQCYGTTFSKFCEVMEDLGLYQVMLACRRFAQEPLEDDSETEGESEEVFLEPLSPEERVIFIDVKKGHMFQLDRDEALDKGCLTRVEGTERMVQEDSRNESLDEIRSKLKSHPTLGIATSLVVRKMVDVDDEHTELEEAEKVNSMWGVQLKKRGRFQQGEEYFFVDPYTDAVGELDREKLLRLGIPSDAIEAFDGDCLVDERETMVANVRRVLNIRLEQQ